MHPLSTPNRDRALGRSSGKSSVSESATGPPKSGRPWPQETACPTQALSYIFRKPLEGRSAGSSFELQDPKARPMSEGFYPGWETTLQETNA